jgi:putative ABC transport system permease protein
MMGELAQELRLASRALLRTPWMAVTILATVGLGIGGTTVMFAAVNAALLRPLPYTDPERLVWIYTDAPPFQFRFSVADYLALETQQTQFERVAGFTNRSMTFSDGSGASLLDGRVVTWTYFSTLGIAPALGRDFTEADGRPDGPPAVIVSHGFWQQRLGGQREVIGASVRLDGAEHTLAGVLPPAAGPLEAGRSFFVAAQLAPPPRRGPFPYWVVGRLRQGVAASAAADELRAINQRIFPIWQASYQDEKATWSLVDLRSRLVGDSRTTGTLALAAVALVWLIAVVNAASLYIARIASRRRELAVRAALGASRWRVVRPVLVESGLLAGGAAAIGAATTWVGLEVLRTVGAAYLPRTEEISFDAIVATVLAALTVCSVLMFGLLPALQGQGSLDEGLRAGGRTATGSRSAGRLRQALVTAQFAIATPLLVIGALLLVSLDELRRVDLGFDGRRIVTGSIQLPAALYRDPDRVTAYWDELSRRLAAVPGVAVAAFADGRPPDGVSNINNFDLESSPTPPGASQPATPWVAVTPGYFAALGIPLIEGRLLDERDATRESLEAVVVDLAWSKRFFGRDSAVGQRFKEGGCTECPWTTVVGVVGDVRYTGLAHDNQGTVYTPLSGRLSRFVVLETAGDPASVVPAVRQAIRAFDPNVPLTGVATIEDLVGRALERPRSLSLLVAGFALVALVLSVVGIYGVMANYVQQRAREICIRLALGGRGPDVLRLVVGRGMRMVAAGIGAGLVAAYAAAGLVSTLLFGVEARDAASYAAVGAFLLTTALVACLIPASRAARLRPADLLRSE